MNTSIAKKENEAPTLQRERETWRKPRYEVSNSKESYEVRVFLPGVPKGGSEVTLENDQLTVVGRRNNTAPENWKQRYSEIAKDNYRLQLQLNVHINSDKVEAKTTDGVLHIKLPLAEESRPRSIKVE